MRKYILSIVSVVIAISLLWIYFTKDDNNKTPEATLDSSPSYAEKTPKHEPLIVSRDQPLYINYHNCKNTLRKYQDSREVWRRESGSYISNYTDDYSSNTILYALTLLDSSEFAYRKRGVTLSEGKNKIRRESKTSNIFQKLGLFENKKRGIEFRLNLSVEKLEKLFELSQDKRQETFNDFGLLVVEVNNAITSGKFSNLQLTELMSQLVDINGSNVDARNHQAINILEAIVDSRNEYLFDKYLKLGGKLISDDFGLNVLERLLLTLRLKDEIPINMIEKLVSNNFLIRKAHNERGDIFLGGYWKQYIFYPKDFNQIVKSLNLVIVGAPETSELLEKDEVLELLALLRINKHSVTSSTLENISLDDVEVCQTIQREAYNFTDKYIYSEQLTLATEMYGDAEESIIDFLNELEPKLVECRLSRQPSYKRTISSNHDSVVYRMAMKGKINKVIDLINKNKWDENRKAFIFWSIVGSKAEYASVLIENNIKPNRNDFLWASRLDALEYSTIADLGFSFEGPSPRNESLVEFASKACNAGLVSELNERKAAYTFGYRGGDALNTALIGFGCKGDEKKVDIITSIMEFKPKIDKHHKNDIARLRMNNYDVYQSIIKLYPQLKIDESRRAYSVSCL